MSNSRISLWLTDSDIMLHLRHADSLLLVSQHVLFPFNDTPPHAKGIIHDEIIIIIAKPFLLRYP
jgi:hypothetical protein